MVSGQESIKHRKRKSMESSLLFYELRKHLKDEAQALSGRVLLCMWGAYLCSRGYLLVCWAELLNIHVVALVCGNQKAALGVIPQELFPLFCCYFRQGPSLRSELASQASLVRQLSACLFFPSNGAPGARHHGQLFHMDSILGVEIRFSCLRVKFYMD